MKLEWSSAAVVCALMNLANTTVAQEGSVELPLARYQELTQARPPSAGAYAFSGARVSVTANDSGADVSVSASVRVFGTGVTLVPLPVSGPIASATAGGEVAPLTAHGAWATDTPGTYELAWTYRAEARRDGDRRALSIALPSTSVELTASLPESDPTAMVAPSSNATIDASGESTQIRATIPASGTVSIAWRAGGSVLYTLSRAHYRGRVEGETARFDAELTVELAGAGPINVPILPSSLALEEALIDRTPAAIASGEDGAFAVRVSGRGRHQITLSFSVPIARGDGLPRVELDLVPTPVSRFELRLAGEREVNVEPHAGVRTDRARGETVATFHVPMSAHVAMEWSEAVPEDAARIETNAHATIVHAVRPDEGVLAIRAFTTIEVARGATSRVELELPRGVEVNTVEARAGAAVSDWRVADGVLTVFLDREVSGRVDLLVAYERAWPTATRGEAVTVPLLFARGVHRQQGMLALLSAGELALEPRVEEHLTRVGDNALPPEVHDAIEETVAHTFRYHDERPRIDVAGAVRPRERGRFDAQVDTLVSIGDVSTGVAILVELDVKSGALDTVSIALPRGLSVLEVSAPSLRRHSIENGALRVELTQPVEGRLVIEVLAERITGEEDQIALPFVRVNGAEVERGRVAVEALAPFQIDVARADRLSPIDPSELPERLRLRTDRPILHAFRYVGASPAPRFAVSVTRHGHVSIPRASIERAHYRTLYTSNGVAVTTAELRVQNERQQFLRVVLPEGSEIWSARVDGREERPARDGDAVLIHVVSAAEAFGVEITYATPVSELGAFGRVRAALPSFDVVVARTRWELFVPAGVSYREPDTSLSLLGVDVAAPPAIAEDTPAPGVRFTLDRSYAAPGAEAPSISIAYARGWGSVFALVLSALGALLFWLGLFAFGVVRLGLPVPAAVSARIPVALSTYRANADAVAPVLRTLRRTCVCILSVSAAGVVLLAIAHGYLATSTYLALAITAIFALGAGGMIAQRRRELRAVTS